MEQHSHEKGFIDYHARGGQKWSVCDTAAAAAASLLTSPCQRVPRLACFPPRRLTAEQSLVTRKHFEVISAN